MFWIYPTSQSVTSCFCLVTLLYLKGYFCLSSYTVTLPKSSYNIGNKKSLPEERI